MKQLRRRGTRQTVRSLSKLAEGVAHRAVASDGTITDSYSNIALGPQVGYDFKTIDRWTAGAQAHYLVNTAGVGGGLFSVLGSIRFRL